MPPLVSQHAGPTSISAHWARAMDIERGTETRFGRDFSVRIAGQAGKKREHRDPAYYERVGSRPSHPCT
jgi:hypothetical protein